MNDLIVRALRLSVFLLAVSLLLWAIYPPARALCAGTAIGLLAGMFNSALLKRRIERLAEAAAGQGELRKGLGLASRVATVLLVGMIATRYPEHVSPIAAISACFIMPTAIVLLGIVQKR